MHVVPPPDMFDSRGARGFTSNVFAVFQSGANIRWWNRELVFAGRRFWWKPLSGYVMHTLLAGLAYSRVNFWCAIVLRRCVSDVAGRIRGFLCGGFSARYGRSRISELSRSRRSAAHGGRSLYVVISFCGCFVKLFGPTMGFSVV